ncbi:hypothetical protein, partial [Ructibacterium gallinarum]|uniref:hypothetical protein n=1 Tax=Ructibacterium gallinarum TaxID=2779355 RepID=UPI001CF9288C
MMERKNKIKKTAVKICRGLSLSKKLSKSWAFCLLCGKIRLGDKNAKNKQERTKSSRNIFN